MKILLIMPPGICHKNEIPVSGYPPLGLAYIAAVLEQEGYKVKIIDASLGGEIVRQSNDTLRFGLSAKEIGQRIKEFFPEVIGISGSSRDTISLAHEIAKISKEILPKVPVIFGGTHSTCVPNEILQDLNVDSVVIGEGELTFLEMVRRIEKKEPFLT